MKRRAFVALAAALPALALGKSRPRVAVLVSGGEGGLRRRIAAGLAEEGISDVELKFFDAPGDDAESLLAAAREAVAWKPDAILAPGPPAALSAQQATTTIPVVFFSVPEPQVFGLVQSLARPGANVTGAGLNSAEITLKRLEIVREILPKARRVTMVFRRRPGGNPKLAELIRSRLLDLAARLRLQLAEEDVQEGSRGFRATLEAIARRPPDAVVGYGPYLWEPEGTQYDPLPLLVGFERRTRAIIVHEWDDPVRHGATVAIGDGGSPMRTGIGILARVLKGANPATLPVELPLRFVLTVNPAGARAIGITLPDSVLIRADKVV